MPARSRFQDEIRALRGILASVTLDIKLIRLQRALRRSGWSEQPRAPAGQPDGGRWVSGPSGQWTSLTDGDGTPTTPVAPTGGSASEQTVLADGTRVLSIRIHAGPRPFDEQHTVVAPDGESRVFETSGATQTIRDGETGEVLARSTFTDRGPEPEAIVQPAFLPAVPAAGAATVELGLMLFTYLSARQDGYGTVLGMTAQEYKPGEAAFSVDWVGKLDQQSLDAACPRNGEVQAITDEVTLRQRAMGNYRTATELGSRIHLEIARTVERMDDPYFKPEVRVAPDRPGARTNEKGTVILDLLEHMPIKRTTCVYDYKTGAQSLTVSRATELGMAARREFPNTDRVIIIQVRSLK